MASSIVLPLKTAFLAIGSRNVDESFFDVFSFRLKRGDPGNALNAPKKVVLSHQAANNLFGRENPMGKIIRVDGERFGVTGVLEKIPANSSISFNMLISSDNWNPNKYLLCG